MTVCCSHWDCGAVLRGESVAPLPRAGTGLKTSAWNAVVPGSMWNAPKTPVWSGVGAQTPAWPGPARTLNLYQNGQEGSSEAAGEC